jgi:hypothetical protein
MPLKLPTLQQVALFCGVSAQAAFERMVPKEYDRVDEHEINVFDSHGNNTVSKG